MNTAIEKVKNIIRANQQADTNFQNFVLQGGAGSGKTESLKEIIAFIAAEYPEKTIACITHTNVAVDEIKSRVGNRYEISTIHSFLNNLIKKYKRNLKEVVAEIFHLQILTEEEHDKYKSAYGKYADKLYSLKKIPSEKVIGKRVYDAQSSHYNQLLNEKIVELNNEITQIVAKKDFETISYNETRFDSFEDLTFSHNTLLFLARKLAEKFNLFPKIISDKFDFIFIDEYQDSSNHTIDIFLKLLPRDRKTTIGLFGDSMQGIYDEGIGTVNAYIEAGLLEKIDKEDNFRCSKQVIDFINILRVDKIKQEVALKKGENLEQREGKVLILYSIIGNKPHARSPAEDKTAYSKELDRVIKAAKEKHTEQVVKQLVLTNKSIAGEVGFPLLYKVFDERYREVNEEIEKDLSRIQAKELAELCILYQSAQYNELIIRIKKNGYNIKSVEDKDRISTIFEHLVHNADSVLSALDYGFENKIIKKSERYKQFCEKRQAFLDEKDNDLDFQKLEKAYLEGGNTFTRISTVSNINISNEEFDEFISALKKKTFYLELFSDQLKFLEILCYQRYLNEETEFITMHKTKGSGIDNVIVVMEEYFWSKYSFESIYGPLADDERKLLTQKLFYVACSRAIKNLTIVRVVEGTNEEQQLKDYFSKSKFAKFEKV